MKKKYFAPSTAIVEAASNVIMSSPDENVGFGDGEGKDQLSNKQQGVWGDVWKK